MSKYYDPRYYKPVGTKPDGPNSYRYDPPDWAAVRDAIKTYGPLSIPEIAQHTGISVFRLCHQVPRMSMRGLLFRKEIGINPHVKSRTDLRKITVIYDLTGKEIESAPPCPTQTSTSPKAAAQNVPVNDD